METETIKVLKGLREDLRYLRERDEFTYQHSRLNEEIAALGEAISTLESLAQQ